MGISPNPIQFSSARTAVPMGHASILWLVGSHWEHIPIDMGTLVPLLHVCIVAALVLEGWIGLGPNCWFLNVIWVWDLNRTETQHTTHAT